MSEISSKYNPQEVEDKWYSAWQEQKLFDADVDTTKKSFCIVIPPPNVTGILHMGHALNNTIQDILIRFHRMKGETALWMPGTDHAGIATQNVVEREIAKQGLKRQDLGREKFLERVWQWREEYGSTIINQLKKLGASCDWRRTRFTMDEEYSQAVKEVFVRLWKDGLIYQSDYIINWCPRCQTALADEEAPHHDVQGKLYYIRYPLKKEVTTSPRHHVTRSQVTGHKTQDYIVVATTRPETMLGDTAVAVNPKDKRFKDLVGKTLILPLIEREIKVIADDFVDPKFGTGLVKVTPAHDPNDYQMGLRHKLEFVNILHPNGVLNENAGEYAGMDRFEAREAILEDLRERKLLEKIDDHAHAIGHCYRCHSVIEPYLSRQWFVKMKPLAKKAIEVVKKGTVKFYPARWTKVYLNWMENIRDWCISRQIWWGHRLPVYYCKNCLADKSQIPNDKFYIALRASTLRNNPERSEGQTNPKSKIHPSSPEASADVRQSFNEGGQNPKQKGVFVSVQKIETCPDCGSKNIHQDEDVLDTWFSSWLWPFATFGWPTVRSQKAEGRSQKKNESLSSDICLPISDLDYFYPTSVLVTAPEIIFFWVARMIMAGLYFVKDIPFRDVYIHGTVRDIEGKKMSKSLGNIIDPLEIINEYGCDALRFSLVSLTSTGQDVFLSKEKFEKGRNFANKLWNASRFILMNLKEENTTSDLCVFFEKENLALPERWILSNFYETAAGVEKALTQYRFNEAINSLYEFFWHKFCDWYVEIAKLSIDDKKTQVVLYKILEKSLRLLHPFMPFITEEIWHRIPNTRTSISIASWPHIQKQIIDKKINAEMQIIIDTVVSVRNMRSTVEIPVKESVVLEIQSGNKAVIACITENEAVIKRLTQAKSICFIKDKKQRSKGINAVVSKDILVNIPLEGLVDIEKEKQRLTAQMNEVKAFMKQKEARLSNKEFLSKAPAHIVEGEKQKCQEFKERLVKLKETIAAIG